MTGQRMVPVDGVSLARTVRDLATDARRTLKRPADRAEAVALLEAIDRIEAGALDRTSGELTRWLASLRRKLETHAGLVVV